MAAGKEIRGKIKSVENTKKITKAMEMVAASKMRKAQERMRSARPYSEKIRAIASNLSQANENPPTGALFTGTGFLVLNDAETSATVTATHNITIPLTGGHIHRGTATVNGPVIFPFVAPYASPIGPLVWAIPAADVVNLKPLGLYMNFHTAVNPGGAIRGTLVRALTSTAATTGAQMRVANALDVSAGYNADLDSVLMSTATASASPSTRWSRAVNSPPPSSSAATISIPALSPRRTARRRR